MSHIQFCSVIIPRIFFVNCQTVPLLNYVALNNVYIKNIIHSRYLNEQSLPVDGK